MGQKTTNETIISKIEKYVNEHPSHGYYLTKDKENVANIYSNNPPKSLKYFYNHILPYEYKNE